MKQTIEYLRFGDAQPLMCVDNVRRCTEKYGGRAVFGWLVGRDEMGLIETHTNHCIWESPDESLWEVTPQAIQQGTIFTFAFRDTVFIRDDTAFFDGYKTMGKPNRYYPVKGIKRSKRVEHLLNKVCELFCLSDETDSEDESRRYTDLANETMHLIPGVPADFSMGYRHFGGMDYQIAS